MRTVYPTYDRDHYLARAVCYGRAAEHEPDPAIREALLTAERECRRRADSHSSPTMLDC
jgi:hypothetical protein